jgi:hypothetical protein
VEDVRVGSEEERYLRALSLLGDIDGLNWSVRPAVTRRELVALTALPGPWAIDTAVRRLGVRGVDLDVSANSDRPSWWPDGPAWSGRGVSARAVPTFAADAGAFEVRVAPMFWWAENRAFPLVPTTGPYPWSDAATPITVDLPQRFGRGPLARLDPGESSVALRWGKARFALTSAAARIGPGGDHVLVLQSDHGGIPRVEFGIPEGVRTPIGTFGAQLGWGRSAHTAWAPARTTGALYSSYSVFTWRPALVRDRLEFGLMRLIHRDWAGLSARDLLVPFGSVHYAKWAGGQRAADNQIASFFTKLRVPEAGLEFFGEFGRNDRSRDLRELLVEPEHNAVWLLGAQRAWRDRHDRLWALNVTGVGGYISPIDPFRGQAFFYEHSPLFQGHTLRGQLLGTSLLQREGGLEMRLDRYDTTGRLGLVLGTRALPNDLAVTVDAADIRQEWTAAIEWSRRGARRAWRGRLGVAADLGYSGDRDAWSVHAALGTSWRR